MKKILIVGSFTRSLINFRGPLLKTILRKGHMVFAAANGHDRNAEAELRGMGIEYHAIRISRTAINPFTDLITLFDLICLMRRLKPDLVLNYTIKPVIFGGFAAKCCRIRAVYSLITGLGYSFTNVASGRQLLVKWIAKFLYSMSLPYSQRIFFQNPDDESAFLEMGLASKDRVVVVSGSGIDLSLFPYSEQSKAIFSDHGGLRFLLIARLLKNKGIIEYAEAARIIRQVYPKAEFHLVGLYDPGPLGLKPKDIHKWVDEGLIKFHGEQSDIRPFIRGCHVYVLPSYREGTPRTVLEAMAIGRAVITTDTPGCRETIKQGDSEPVQKTEEGIEGLRFGRNGILVPVKNVKMLVTAIEFFIRHPEQSEIMGLESRDYAEERYDVDKINKVMLNEMGL